MNPSRICTELRDTGQKRDPSDEKSGGFSAGRERLAAMTRKKSGKKSGGENTSRSMPAPKTRAAIFSAIIFAISPL